MAFRARAAMKLRVIEKIFNAFFFSLLSAHFLCLSIYFYFSSLSVSSVYQYIICIWAQLNLFYCTECNAKHRLKLSKSKGVFSLWKFIFDKNCRNISMLVEIRNKPIKSDISAVNQIQGISVNLVRFS